MSAERNINELIGSLASDLKPVRRLAHPFLRVMPWFFLAGIYVFGVVYFLGLRPDFSEKIYQSEYLMDLGLIGFMGLSAALASSWLCIPDMRGQNWVVVVPLTLFFTVFLWFAAQTYAGSVFWPAIHWNHCFNDGALIGALPAAAFVFLAKKGATTRPRLMAFMNFLVVAALGYIGLRLTCPVDTIGHALIYHLAPFIIFGGLLGLLARKIYSW